LPTPALAFAKDRFWGDGAVMVTGSHRPMNENGFKITLGKFPATAADVQELQETVRHQGPFASGSGKLHVQNSLEPYASFLMARFVPVDPLTVVVNANNGAMQRVAVPVLLSLGYQVVERTYGSGNEFAPDPFLPENQALLAQAVHDQGAHLGVAYDGDGDQVVFVTERGRVLTPEQVLVLLARALLVYQPGSQVVYDAAFAPFVIDEIRKVGGTPVPLALSAAELKIAFLKRGAVLGCDRWGHYFFRSMGGDDALHATLVLLRLISRSQVGLESLLGDHD
jgi:phosphomannomutase